MGGLGSDKGEVKFLELGDLGGLELVEETSDTSVQDADLLFSGDGNVLLLLEELGKLLTSVEELLGGSIKIGTELGEGGDLSVLSQLELHGTGDLLHGLDLGGGTDTGDGKTDVNSGTDTLVEELGLQKDLTISNGNHIGGNVGRHITSLGLNDGESGEGSVTVVLVHLSGTLEETGVKIEDITGVSLTTWGTSEEEGHLTVSDGLLGEIVVDDKSVHTVITEVLTNSAARVRGQELEGSGIGGGSGNNDGVLKGLTLTEETHDVGDGRSLLTNGDVDAEEGLGKITGLMSSLLVKDGINSNGGFASLSITNDQFTLSTTDGDEGVDGLETSLHGLVDGLSGDNTGSLKLDSLSLVGEDGALAVNGVAESVDNTTEHTVADGNIDDGTSSLDNITFLNFSIVTKHDNTNVVSLEVKGHTLDARVEFDHLTSLDLGETEDSSDTITNGDDSSEFLQVILNTDFG